MAKLRTVILAAIVVLVITAGTALAAAPGSSFRLGVLNTVNQVTRLTGSLAGAMLGITNNGSGPALQLTVKSGVAPMSVNSTTKVARLNADLLDGLNASAFLRTDGTAANSDQLDGADSSAFMGSRVVIRESALSTGLLLNDGTRKAYASCSSGEILLSGGYANVDIGTIVLESFPTGPTSAPNDWAVRIVNDGTDDSFTVVILCAKRGA